MTHLLIHTEGDARTGLGHLSRTLALAKALRGLKSGIRVSFLLPDGSHRDSVIKSRFPIFQVPSRPIQAARRVLRIAEKTKAHLLITDSYRLNGAYYDTLRREGPALPVLAFDDFGEKTGFALHGFINGGLAAAHVRYPQALRPESALGPDFFPIKENFLKAKPVRSLPKRNQAAIIMGSSDPERQTARLLRLLKGMNAVDGISVIVGPLNKDHARIKKIAGADRRIRIYRNPANLPRILKQARLAITAGGVTCGELAYLGVPMAVLCVADNQILSAKAVEAAGCAVNLGFYRNRSDAWLAKRIQDLLGDSKKLQRMSHRGKKLIPGKGSRALAAHVAQVIQRYHADRFSEGTVHAEYERSSKAKSEFQKVKWGSAEGMENRFRLAIRKIGWKRVKTWLDIGSGTGGFLETAEKNHTISRFIGLDLSPALLRYSRSKAYRTRNAEFIRGNFTHYAPKASFDLVTALGVLQKSSVPLRKAMAKMALLVKMGGQVFVTTKNKDWDRLKKPGFKAYAGHHWFTESELRQAARLAGLKIRRFGGFEPRSGREIPVKKAHSVYLLLRRLS